MKPFWKYHTFHRPSESGIHWIEPHLLDRAFRTKETLTRYYNAGSVKPGSAIEEVLAELTKLGGHMVRQQISNRHANHEWMYTWDDTGVVVEYWSKNRGINVTVVSLNKAVSVPLHAYFDSIITRSQTKGRVYVVVSSTNGPRLQEMGVAGEDFIPSNYRPETVKQYKHVIDDLNKSDPCGRIVLLDGPPGTGKTHMVRAILNEVSRGTFILVPSNFIGQLGDPSFLNVLIGEQRKGCPMILILEDADEALVNRKEGNSSAISALLNFSDGIFGTLLDMRLICTTNVEINNLDPAVTRDGRLCTRLEIGLLDTEMANVIYERLTGKKGDLKDRFYKLGTVYKIAKGNGLTVEREQPQKRMGFTLSSEKSAEQTVRELKSAMEHKSENVDEIALETIEALRNSLDSQDPEDLDLPDQSDGEYADMKGEVITAVTKNGEMIEVGHIDQHGNLVITDEAFMDSDDDLIDEDPEDDANEMPEYLDDSEED
jgi:hypothetical protein